MAERVLLCARVSIDQQAEHGYGLDAQLTALRGRAAERGYEVVPGLIFR
jgi:DNA invertase Pin-like site-specific DNA recombinase